MQTKKQSAAESIVNIVIGLIISFSIQLILYPLMNIPVTLNQNIIITIVFFIASFLRSYFIRRYFNKKHTNEIIEHGLVLHCFQCEIKMPTKVQHGILVCSNCGLSHF